ncbi:MAG: hypothetical protein GY778_07070, partial [bacterium]|nr:hypothetical protein [bacterium]
PPVPIRIEAPATVKAGESVRITVIADNRKVGHTFPTGPLDVIQAADAIALAACPVALSGDVNADGTLSSSDVVELVNYVFKGGPGPLPVGPAGDGNCSGHVTATDVMKLVNFVFRGGPPPCDICSLL